MGGRAALDAPGLCEGAETHGTWLVGIIVVSAASWAYKFITHRCIGCIVFVLVLKGEDFSLIIERQGPGSRLARGYWAAGRATISICLNES